MSKVGNYGLIILTYNCLDKNIYESVDDQFNHYL